MTNPMEEISQNDAQTICILMLYGIYPDRYPSIYQYYYDKYSKEAVDAKMNECNSSNGKKKKDISSQELLANYRIQQLQKNKMDQFKGESN